MPRTAGLHPHFEGSKKVTGAGVGSARAGRARRAARPPAELTHRIVQGGASAWPTSDGNRVGQEALFPRVREDYSSSSGGVSVVPSAGWGPSLGSVSPFSGTPPARIAVRPGRQFAKWGDHLCAAPCSL